MRQSEARIQGEAEAFGEARQEEAEAERQARSEAEIDESRP